MNENETIATAVVADYEGKQGKAAMARHEKLGQIIEDAMYTLAHVSRQLAFGGELHKRNTFELKGLIARVRERVRQPAMACSCVGMLVLGMVMWNGRDSVQTRTDADCVQHINQLCKSGAFNSAIRESDDAVTKFPESVPVVLQRAAIFESMGQHQKALNIVDKLLGSVKLENDQWRLTANHIYDRCKVRIDQFKGAHNGV